MKKFLMMLVVAFTCMSFLAPVAEAKRLGGGSSFGKQRSMPQKQAQKAPTSNPAPAAPASNGNKWLGPLAGLALGAGLMSLFSGGGMAGLGNMLSSLLPMLLLGGLALLLYSKFKQSQRPAMQTNMPYAGSGAAFNNAEATQRTSYSASMPSASLIPHDFPVDSFLRNAKSSFIRLQAANDRKDADDIRGYTTPEVFAEIAMQMQERGDAVQKTDVIVIDAELLEVANEGDFTIASVRFSGQLRENNGVPENIDEVWHIQKNTRDTEAKWLLAGIQQAALH